MAKLEYAGIAFPGRTGVREIMDELERQHQSRKDFLYGTEHVSFVAADGQFGLRLPDLDSIVPLNDHAMQQMCEFIGLPRRSRLYKRLRFGYNDDATIMWGTMADLFNDVLHKMPAKRLFRTMATESGERYLRAFLSDRYSIVDNRDIFYAAYEKLQAAAADIWHARISDDHFMIYAVSPTIMGDINETDETTARQRGARWESDDDGRGDAFHAACVIRNSETGEGRVEIRPAILRKVCYNYCVYQEVLGQRHVGSKYDEDNTFLTTETIRKKQEVFFDEIGDVIGGVFDPVAFQKYLDQLRGAKEDEIGNAVEAVDALRVVYDISEERKEQILNRLAKGGDLSRFGLINSVTEEAYQEDVYPEEGMALEVVGASLAGTTMEDLMAEYNKKKPSEKVEVDPGDDLDL